LTVTTE